MNNINIFSFIFYLIMIVMAMRIIALALKDNNKEETVEKSKTIYKKKDFMTLAERDFFRKIKVLETDYNYRIVPQLNLATIVQKTTNSYYYTDLFRNIDFAIFDNDYKQLLLLIELNDATHRMKKRQARDIKIQNICKEIGVPLLKFYTNYSNETTYVVNRIIKTITENNNAN